MAFPRGPVRPPAPPRVRSAVFAVGRRVYVAGVRSAAVTLTDDAERPSGSSSDGAEVTIVAWRPGSGGKTRYCVRVADSGVEGWLSADDLRATKTPTPASPAGTPSAARPTPVRTAVPEASARRFGQRSS